MPADLTAACPAPRYAFLPAPVRHVARAARNIVRAAAGRHHFAAAPGPGFDAAVRAAVLGVVTSIDFRDAVHGIAEVAAKQPEIMLADGFGMANRVDKGTQILLAERYKELARRGDPLPGIDGVGFRAFSQFDEDGILLYIFALIGAPNRKAVEACAGVGYESCSANWVVNHGWDALLMDGNKDNCRRAWNFFAGRAESSITPPAVACEWIEAHTINGQVAKYGFAGDIDLLTIDMDGVDYWVWKALTAVNPRVVVVEYQPWWGPDEPYTIKNVRGYHYSDYEAAKKGYIGSSLGAYVNLAREKGYRLVGCNRNRLNAFFVRNDLGVGLLPEVTVASCLTGRRVAAVTAEVRPHVEAQLAAGEWVRG